MQPEVYISVDVETAGPIPARYAMLSIGACLVEDHSINFYVELQPDRDDSTPEAMAIGGFSLEGLKESGAAPKDAMQAFADWVNRVVSAEQRPVFVAFNAPFVWSFVIDYFYRYLGENPFGHSALDIKAYYMGLTGVTWAETSMQHITAHIAEEKHLTHNALSDAQDQSEIFRLILGITSRWWAEGDRRVVENDPNSEGSPTKFTSTTKNQS
jgi:ribonuclease T